MMLEEWCSSHGRLYVGMYSIIHPVHIPRNLGLEIPPQYRQVISVVSFGLFLYSSASYIRYGLKCFDDIRTFIPTLRPERFIN